MSVPVTEGSMAETTNWILNINYLSDGVTLYTVYPM